MKKKIKVLHMLTSLNAGGAETNLLSLLKYGDREHFEYAVAFGGSGGTLEEEYRALNIKLIQLFPRPLDFWAYFQVNTILQKLSVFSPDIVHSHLDACNIIGLVGKKKYGYNIIFHHHGFGIIPRKFLPERSVKHKFWELVSRSYKYCDKCIAICNFQIPFLQALKIRDDQIVLIPNGIDIEENVHRNRDMLDGFTFVNVARFFPAKNHYALVIAFKKVLEIVPSAKLVLVGEGELKSEITKLVCDLDITENVKFLGVRRDVPEILSTCDCFVLSSRWELHPITILEAMRAGIPVIATKVGGVEETVLDNCTGLLIESDNVELLSKAMIKLASDKSLGNWMGENGRQRAVEFFDNKNVIREIEKIYLSI